ncbi:MAG: UdgX family uracil-DNA binding protein [Xanthobacteraceae bacterium]
MTETGEPLPPITTLAALREAEAACTRCPLHRDATQVVPGEGPATARLMLVGEQPGDQEDLQGRPFVGPAGRVLDRAMIDAGLDRSKAFVTNAVKHFKWEQRGKRRLHKKPSAYEIDRCRWWNDLERAIIRPDLAVALGVTAAVSLLGRTVTISRVRGTLLQGRDGAQVIVTVHPSYLLRLTDDADKAREYDRFVADLRLCAEHLRAAA